MRAQGRVGDIAQSPADSHGCPACPHPTAGPATTGSANVHVNGLSALRIDDNGVHAACCGPNRWRATEGSKNVFINGKPSHRAGDATAHCGGDGQLVRGSANVFVGDRSSRTAALAPSAELTWIEIELLDQWGKPIPYAVYTVVTPGGEQITGRLNSRGHARVDGIQAGHCQVSFPEIHAPDWEHRG